MILLVSCCPCFASQDQEQPVFPDQTQQPSSYYRFRKVSDSVSHCEHKFDKHVRLETRTGAEEVIERLHGRMVRGWNDAGSRISVRFADTSEQRELRVSYVTLMPAISLTRGFSATNVLLKMEITRRLV
jgi:hypothetical protein